MAQRAPTVASSPRTRRLRRTVLCVALAATAVKLYLAATTLGTFDIHTFKSFAHLIHRFGPISIYSRPEVDGFHGNLVYNHPPLVGWLLVLFGRLEHHPFSFEFLIRVPATLADIATTMLVFELVRIRRPLGEAAIAGVLVACSPVLIVVSGFHGNTDPVFVMFALLSLYLLVTDRSGILAGLSFAAAISIKILPIVTLPVLLLMAARAGRRKLLEFLGGSGAALLVLWGPVVVAHQWHAYAKNVLGYKGVPGKWGIIEIGTKLGLSDHALRLIEGPGRLPLLLVSCALPLYVAWRRPAASIPAFGMAMVLVWLLSTGSSAGRYLVWAVAAAFIVNVPAAAVYDIAASILIVHAYDRYAGGWPWDYAHMMPWTHLETALAGIAWLALLAVVVLGVMNLRTPAEPPDTPEPRDITQDDDAREVQLSASEVH